MSNIKTLSYFSGSWTQKYTVDIFLGEPGESTQLRFFRVGRISSIVKPKNLLIWENFAQIERNSPEIFGAKLNCADSPILGEKNNYCVVVKSAIRCVSA
jgi:hypothetical protein